MMNDPQPWEVWWAEVYFEDHPEEAKRRPVLVLENQTCIVLSLKITSHPPRMDSFRGEYALQKWHYAGLTKPSTVRISKLLRLQRSDFVDKVGELHPIDIGVIERYISMMYHL